MNSWRYEETQGDRSLNWSYQEAVIPLPEAAAQWLARLTLLYDVPLPYLVPSEQLLPMNSIRFFTVDPQWTAALTDGALSLGRVTEPQARREAAFNPLAAEQAEGLLRVQRQTRMHPNHRRSLPNKRSADVGVLSGFFLRSVLVSHWKGVEVRGYNGGQLLTLLRMEALTNRILLCIFEGEITRIELVEPKEELHFGVRGNDRTIDLRRVDAGHEGEPLLRNPSDPHSVVTHLIPTAANGRVDVLKLASELEPVLGLQQNALDSTRMALEMLSVAGRAEFTLCPKPSA